ncbi:hypothetical protein [Granulicella rosea]|uniref:hypothetical protein n=1 Tax=Granulicella rosea TaxID=474952 RepID=UPI001595E6F9|nr:hypothetical protein [Granulicella rosea]
MKRILSILVLLLFGLPLAAPLLALAQDAPLEAATHACCRRGGAHHCMSPETSANPGAGLRAPLERCPYAPASVVATGRQMLVPGASAAIFAELVSHPAVHAQTESRRRIALDRARRKRGPPALSL